MYCALFDEHIAAVCAGFNDLASAVDRVRQAQPSPSVLGMNARLSQIAQRTDYIAQSISE